MGKKSLDREEILRYLGDEWRFRIKTVKGRMYMTRRRGQEERGVGLFDAELWARIKSLMPRAAEGGAPSIQEESVLEKGSTDLPDKTTDWIRAGEEYEENWRRLLKDIYMYRGVEMMKTCTYVDEEGFCSYWNWEDRPGFFGLLDELMGSRMYKKRRVSRRGLAVDRWVVKALHWYCSSCPVYRP